MPSYLERDQLKSVSPYVTDTDAILRNFQTKLNYWGQGAAQVKSAYERYANLELTRDDNKEGLSEFMKGAKEQVKNAANTDLSVGDNIVNAQEIFKPLQGPEFRNIMGDNALTKFFNSQYSIANVYKNKDGGKEYSDTNLRDIQQQHADFKNAKDPGSWEEFMGKRREYTPYIDVKGKVQKLMTDFYENDNQIGGTSITSIGQNPMYLLKEENKSVKAERLKRYINENLSDKDKNQLAIESRVNLHDLISVYGEPKVSEEYWNKNIDNTKNLRIGYAVELSSINDKIKILSGRTLTDSEEALLKDDKVRKELIEKTISKIDKTIEGFSDPKAFSEFRKNLEGNVRSLYIDDFTTGLSNAYSKTDYTQSISQNTAYFSALAHSLGVSRLNEEIRSNKANEEIAAYNAEINAKNAKKAPEDINPAEVTTTVAQDTEVEDSGEGKTEYETLKAKQAAIENSMQENIKPLKVEILSVEGGIHDYTQWEKYFQDNKDKLTTLKLSDMPDYLQKAAISILSKTGKYPNGIPMATNIGDVRKQFDEYTQKVFMTHAKDGMNASYNGVQLGEMISNQDRYIKEKETYDNIEKSLQEFLKKHPQIDYRLTRRESKNIFSEVLRMEHARKTVVPLENRKESLKYLADNFPILKRALVGTVTSVNLDKEDGATYARSIGFKLANEIMASGKGNSFGGKVLQISITDINGSKVENDPVLSGDVTELNPEAREAIRNIRWDDNKNPMTELKYVKKADHTGYWTGTFATGDKEKSKFVNFKIKAPVPDFLNDPIADYIITNAKTYSKLVGENGNKIEIRGTQISGEDTFNGFKVTTTMLVPKTYKNNGKEYVDMELKTETLPVPPAKKLTDIENEFNKNAYGSNKMLRAITAFKAANNRNPLLKELQEELKKIK